MTTFSWGDAYTFITVGAFVGLVALAFGWCVDRWQRRVAMRRFRLSPEFRDFEATMRQAQQVCGTALVGPASRMADALAELARRMPAPPGTVQNPSDPSPRPRSHH